MKHKMLVWIDMNEISFCPFPSRNVLVKTIGDKKIMTFPSDKDEYLKQMKIFWFEFATFLFMLI